MVYKATMVPGPNNDTCELFINPTIGDAEPTPDAISTSLAGGGNDASPAGGWGDFRLRIANNTGQYDFDELRVGSTWESVTPLPGPPTAPVDLDLATDDDTGLVDSDNITALTTGLTISGVAELGISVRRASAGSTRR